MPEVDPVTRATFPLSIIFSEPAPASLRPSKPRRPEFAKTSLRKKLQTR
jgi:hypothetical protein